MNEPKVASLTSELADANEDISRHMRTIHARDRVIEIREHELEKLRARVMRAEKILSNGVQVGLVKDALAALRGS
jgi:predicted small metal-binding protein